MTAETFTRLVAIGPGKPVMNMLYGLIIIDYYTTK